VFGKHLFPGGTHPHEGPGGKRDNCGNAIVTIPAPARVVIPLSQHIGAPAKAIVQAGDHVDIGQMIAEAGGFVSAPIHASVSGTVKEITTCKLANGNEVPAIVIDNDGKETWTQLHPAANPEALTPKDVQEIVRNAGIVGMGGATFPTSVKLSPAPGKVIEMFIINGAECEPYLTADHRLMLEHTAEIIDGLVLLMKAFDVKKTIIGIEQNKPDAIAALSKAASGKTGIEVRGLPVRYPQGGEKQLIYATTRRAVPNGGLPLDVGCVVCNVGTVYAIQQAIRLGKPLIERVTTVGGLVEKPGNFLVRVGTPIGLLIKQCGGLKPETCKLLNGGPMMGFAFDNLAVPVTKGCSGILALGKEAIEPEASPCIRCGRCMRACPMKLAPAKLDALVLAGRIEAAEKNGVMNCLECGACTFACPAKRPLTKTCREGKRIINAARRAAQAAKK